ncbi:MAG TPA: extracellular solute-binding protein [Actinomycetota bacterium]|nr:extracellular solute-binding protein [Actinomycetota bacterium]
MDTEARSREREDRPASVIRTFLIADLRGYTSLSDARGDQAAADVAERFVAIARESAEAGSGTIVEVRGDEVLAVFDSAREALRAALALQEGIGGEAEGSQMLGVGIGLDAGEAVSVGNGFRGRALNLAARLCARARSGEILVTSELVHLAGSVEGVRFDDRGAVRLKGVSRPVDVFAVTAASGAAAAPASAGSIAGHLAFRLLGPLEVTDGGRPVTLGGPRQRLVLAHLLLAANRVVTMDELIERVWDEDPPRAARNTIQSYVSHLRAELRPDRIEGRSPGYVIHAEADELDVLRFEQLLRRARRLLPTDPREAAGMLEEALALWIGSPLSDLADAASLDGEIARLQELRVSAIEDLVGARLNVGEHAEVLPDLERLIREHPLRERLWAHLMLARYRSGRQAEALDAFRQAQELLADELGIDPSPELRELQRRILQQDPALQLTGKPLRGYRLLERVGEGAFGVVWRALDPELGREVGVKQIHPRLSDDPSFVRRFEQEAQTIARLEHPHVVPLYDYWRDGSGAYLVMRWMRGGSLEDVLVRSKPEPEHAAKIVDQLAGALSAAHRAHTVHRDVKPANVLLDDDGNAYLSDFGIAEDLTDWRDSVPPEGLGYSAPELLRGEDVTPSADIFALGMIAQDLMNGRGGDPRVAGVIGRATADDPRDRFRDAEELARALREALGATSTATAERRPSRSDERNPYKGLHSFVEADADDFFGRDALIDTLVDRLAEPVEGSRFLAVVGPSGSGKSSAVRAGLVPTLRSGALPGSEAWFFVEMLPGSQPFEELETALQQVAVDPPSDLLEILEASDDGLAQVVGRILPDDGTELVLVVDQLEEVFTMVEDEELRNRFLRSLVVATQGPDARLRVIVTLRADFYDRPLSVPEVADLMRTRTATVVPLTPEELERAIDGPAGRVAVTPELALIAEMVADVSERSGALPLLQYALTELFELRRGNAMTLEAYRELGGVSGALARRAEDLYERLNPEGRRAAKQVFLRLVTVGEGVADTRRLVPRSELLSLRLDSRAIEGVIDLFGRHRLLAFDRDPATRGSTVEVAHEALLRSWDRLRIWIDDARVDLLQHRRLASAAADWDASSRDPGLLPRGRRLEDLASWAASSELILSRSEEDYLAEGVHQREEELRDKIERAERESTLERRSVVRLRALVAVLTAAVLVAAGLTALAVSRASEAQRLRDDGHVAALTGSSLSNLESDPELSVLLALHAIQLSDAQGVPVPSETVEALHWGMQEAGATYPVGHRDDLIEVVAGPLGTRGVFDLPIADLANAARAKVPRDLTEEECGQFFPESECPSLSTSFPPSIAAEPITPVPPPPGEPVTPLPALSGTRVTMLWGAHADPDTFLPFTRELRAFTERTGIEVEFVNIPDLETWITAEQAAGESPDLASAIPGIAADLGRQGLLVDMGTYIDLERLKEVQSPYLVSMGTVGVDGSWPADDGHLYGAFTRVNVKGIVWYPKPELRAAGYEIPTSGEELVELTDRLRADGETPWCMGLESGEADGWPATDWIENLVLNGAGPEVYDDWTYHRLPFDSPPIRLAFEQFGEVVFTEGSVLDGPEGAADTPWEEAQRPMMEAPPRCWLYLFPTFAALNLDPDDVGTATDTFPFPAMAGTTRGMIGGGELISALSDRPEVRELVRFFLSAEHGIEAAESGLEHMSPNLNFDVRHYPPFVRRQAEALQEALAADTFRFDASDLMPPPIGDRLFWDAMMRYVREGPESLDEVLAELDAAWPDTG